MVRVKVMSKGVGARENGAKCKLFRVFPCTSNNYITKKAFMS